MAMPISIIPIRKWPRTSDACLIAPFTLNSAEDSTLLSIVSNHGKGGG
jgi:hypothetical protein